MCEREKRKERVSNGWREKRDGIERDALTFRTERCEKKRKGKKSELAETQSRKFKI